MATDAPPPPKNWRELKNHPYAADFRKAQGVEIDKIFERGTWTIIDIKDVPDKHKKNIIPTQWVHDYKTTEEGRIKDIKARCVVRGDLERGYISKSDTYAATLAAKYFRALMAIAAAEDLEVWSLDAVNAFLLAWLTDHDEEIYVHLPPGHRQEGKCARLNRPLYGLKRAARIWLDNIREKLAKLGYQTIPEEPCIWHHPEKKVWILVYVDDFLVVGKRDAVDKARADLKSIYEMKDLGPARYFLGIEIIRNR